MDSILSRKEPSDKSGAIHDSQVPEVRARRADSCGTNLQGYRAAYELFVRGMWIDVDRSSANGA